MLLTGAKRVLGLSPFFAPKLWAKKKDGEQMV